MQPSVRSSFIAFSAQFEGACTWLYLDVHDPPLVTTGIGNLVDPMSEALGLPWRDLSGKLAPHDAIVAEWTTVKGLATHAHDHPSFWANRALLRLATADVNVLVLSKLGQFAAELKARPCFAGFDSWPADAQLGLLSMSWAMGPAFHFPMFEAACQAHNFSMAAAQCHMADGNNPGLVPRNRANFRLFVNASQVEAEGMDRTALYYPQVL